MSDRRRLERFVRTALQGAGQQYEDVRRSTSDQLDEAREAYATAKRARELPTDDEGRVKLVCRRHAERRAAALDEAYRPACYEANHPDCEGCVEDVHAGRIETW